MFEVEEPKKGKLWIVKNGAAKERLVRAERRHQVESFILQDFEIAPARADDAFALGRQGIEEESVG